MQNQLEGDEENIEKMIPEDEEDTDGFEDEDDKMDDSDENDL